MKGLLAVILGIWPWSWAGDDHSTRSGSTREAPRPETTARPVDESYNKELQSNLQELETINGERTTQTGEVTRKSPFLSMPK